MFKNGFYSLLFLSLLFSCKKGEVKEVSQKVSSVKSYTYNELKPLLEKNDGKTYVVNFWATWCAPCVKELPAFEKLNKEYAAKNVEVILVSLDFPKQVDKRLIPFINKHNLQSKVVLLNDINEDVWIKAIDSTWSGAIPATLIYNANGRTFYEQSFDYEELETELKTIL
ncbi:TlpA family protein disulfide reductase [Polaribacter sp. R2A056_3_33]|uniref:TlpA family protein disulfide reductase n=1 Tax=unclassified Polaribacter TaxID=196858 RepID=UPI001C4E6453|nr:MULTISPECIES: TlpA disulfide reductase family protein [unclassified Polaribacter]QXP62819.1 TlpA family protein disulfide reductase [Polaribacter sp. HaHaR_3_91]QXP70830.1 TlpA family protein disulfide reductase [Polaribacter sp. R2A056_3_33]